MTHYVLAPEAELDLNEIWEYIAQDSISAADRWIEKLEAAFDLLAGAPGLGHTRVDWTDYPLRFWPVGACIAIYRVQAERVEIVALTQGSRNIPTFLDRRGL